MPISDLPVKTEFGLYDSKRHSICTTFDGQRFLCDTDYHTSKKMTTEEIKAELEGELHVCITGGEPLMHDLTSLLSAFDDQYCHIETSGTLPVKFNPHSAWITCCPKQVEGKPLHDSIFGEADECKFLVGPNFNEESFILLAEQFTTSERYLQPINGVNEVWQENLSHCLELLKKYPYLKLSAQLHKYLGVR